VTQVARKGNRPISVAGSGSIQRWCADGQRSVLLPYWASRRNMTTRRASKHAVKIPFTHKQARNYRRPWKTDHASIARHKRRSLNSVSNVHLTLTRVWKRKLTSGVELKRPALQPEQEEEGARPPPGPGVHARRQPAPGFWETNIRKYNYNVITWSVVVKELRYKPEGQWFETRLGEWFSPIYLILPAAIGTGVYYASYQKWVPQTGKKVYGEKNAVSAWGWLPNLHLWADCWTIWGQHLTTL
jgi:hypothetical protein